ncbi:MAG: hypothetical protein ACT4P7_23570 [Gemmatimonadaceae bacterium]
MTIPRKRDFHQDGDEATLRIHEKGNKRRAIGIHFAAAHAIQEYVHLAGLTSGPLFRPRLHARREDLAPRHMNEVTMSRTFEGYLTRLPGAVHTIERPDGTTRQECRRTQRRFSHRSWHGL